MRSTAIVILILFFLVLAIVLYYSLNNQSPPVPVNGKQNSNAFGLLDSRYNGV